MEKQQLERIETLLQIIADELYVARLHHQYAGARGPEFEEWETGGRNEMIQRIEKMREQGGKFFD